MTQTEEIYEKLLAALVTRWQSRRCFTTMAIRKGRFTLPWQRRRYLYKNNSTIFLKNAMMPKSPTRESNSILRLPPRS